MIRVARIIIVQHMARLYRGDLHSSWLVGARFAHNYRLLMIDSSHSVICCIRSKKYA